MVRFLTIFNNFYREAFIHCYLEFDIFRFDSDLFHIVSHSQSDRSIFWINTLVIDRNTVWSSDFILSAVRFPDIPAIVKFAHISFG